MKKHTLYMATRLENGASDLVCTVSKKREELENIEGGIIRDAVQYKTREQAIAGLQEQLPYIMDTTVEYLYDSMVQNGGFFESCI